VRFLEDNECAEWCRLRGGETGERFALRPDPALTQQQRLVWDRTGGADPTDPLARCLSVVDGAESCLLWITLTEVWPSSEDWPAYYALRGARNEKRSVAVAPGHLFEPASEPDLRVFLDVALRFGWDAHLLPSCDGTIPERLRLSHDGWIERQASVQIPKTWGQPVSPAT